MDAIHVYLEIGRKRAFASAVDWPGWSRSGRDEETALQALLACGPRYAQVLQGSEIEFQAPGDTFAFVVTERLEGNATTDFGAPAIVPEADGRPMDHTELERSRTLLQACWQAFDSAVQRATGRELRKGPRGGGRDLERIVHHVIQADQGYLRSLAWRQKGADQADVAEALRQTRQAILSALEAAVNEGLPAQGPRGGTIWPPRYFVRRIAWHVLDHAWEIEDRVV